jgi:hypothetical protein
MPSWPSSLPTKAIAGSHRYRPQPNAVVFTPDVGEPIRRRRYTGTSTADSFTIKVNSAQANRLYEFYNIDCAQGTLSFFAPLIDGITRKWWFDTENPPDFSNIRGGTAYEIQLSMGCRR